MGKVLIDLNQEFGLSNVIWGELAGMWAGFWSHVSVWLLWGVENVSKALLNDFVRKLKKNMIKSSLVDFSNYDVLSVKGGKPRSRFVVYNFITKSFPFGGRKCCRFLVESFF